MIADVNHWRANLVEAVAEFDDRLMEKFFEDPNQSLKMNFGLRLRKATIANEDHSTSLWICI
jgi:elongation factor G